MLLSLHSTADTFDEQEVLSSQAQQLKLYLEKVFPLGKRVGIVPNPQIKNSSFISGSVLSLHVPAEAENFSDCRITIEYMEGKELKKYTASPTEFDGWYAFTEKNP